MIVVINNVKLLAKITTYILFKFILVIDLQLEQSQIITENYFIMK